MPKKKELVEYHKKRDFSKTPEPAKSSPKKNKKLIFVVQKHVASHLHFDFRLEVGNVLVSWAVPKGPSLNPSDKRLAVQTEDHPRDYATFEGIIPKGEYGGGTVMVWDIGDYDSVTVDDKGKPLTMEQALKKGKVEVFLHGKKLNGKFALIKTKVGWLFMKMRDEYASTKKLISNRDRSALTGRTMNQIKEEG